MANPGDEREEEVLEEAPLLTHLTELRDRLLRAVAAVLVVFAILAPFARRIFSVVAQPLIAQLPEGATMIATQVASPFVTPIKTTFFVALFIAMPVVIYQTWAFVAPGLYRKERRFAVPLLVSSVILFYIGAAFAYFLVFPTVFRFLAATTPEGVTMMTDIASYLDFALLTSFSFGAAFEVPIATVLLIGTGIVSAETLARQRAYVFLGAFIVAAVLTPPDVVSQIMLAVPMYLLFEAGLVLARTLYPATADDSSTGKSAA
ncbi:MAG: twin-arginine translocase subunit TatC [Gammaproteobacteria bacterium]|nr:MAG: twin-arginine translocase subunit TatC [Gammaproteobacteria bacterium]